MLTPLGTLHTTGRRTQLRVLSHLHRVDLPARPSRVDEEVAGWGHPGTFDPIGPNGFCRA